MESVPILINGSYERGSIGKVEMTPALAQLYATYGTQHLMMNPILKARPGLPPEIVAYSVYPMPSEPSPQPRKRCRPKRTPNQNE